MSFFYEGIYRYCKDTSLPTFEVDRNIIDFRELFYLLTCKDKRNKLFYEVSDINVRPDISLFQSAL